MSGYLYKVFLLVVMFLIGNNFYAQSNFTVEINKINYTYYSPPVPDGLFTITFTPGAQQTIQLSNSELSFKTCCCLPVPKLPDRLLFQPLSIFLKYVLLLT